VEKETGIVELGMVRRGLGVGLSREKEE